MRVHPLRTGAGLALGVTCLVAPARAQSVTVRVLTDSLRAPVAGAIVRLLDGTRTLAQGLTGLAGRVTLHAPHPGGYSLRVGRIGFLTPPPWPITLAEGQDAQVDLRVSGDRVTLPTLAVEGERRCGGIADERAMAAVLWEQIRQALIATELTQHTGRTFTRTLFVRELSRSLTIRSERWLPGRTGTGSAYVAARPMDLARNGFVVKEQGDSVTYYAPDAAVLLSDPFVDTHCFRVISAASRLSEPVGLAFEPSGDRGVADISGVLWVDRKSVELKSLEYRYTNVTGVPPDADIGGRILFQRLPGGEWFIRDWAIRMPNLVRVKANGADLTLEGRDSLRGYFERGGIAEPVGAIPAMVSPAMLTGLVYDSLAGHGLAGVVVRVAGAADTAVTDSLGTFALSVPVSGSRTVMLRHSLLELPPDQTAVTAIFTPGAATHFVIATSSAATLSVPFCAREPGGSRLVGLARPVSGRAGSDFLIEARWIDAFSLPVTHGSYRRTAADTRGLWAFCDLPEGVPITVRQLDGSRELAKRTASLPRNITLWLDLGAQDPP